MTHKGEVSSSEVIEFIDNKQSNGFSENELKNISIMMKGLSEKELIKVKNHIETKITEESKSKLLGLAANVESLNNLPYGFEGIIEGSESEFFTEMFDSEPRKVAIGAGINNLLSENISSEILSGLGVNQKETIQLLIWNKVVSKIGFMSGSSYMMEKGLEKFTGIIDSTKSVVSKGSDVVKDEDFDITKLGETFDKIQAIFESDDKDKEKKGNKLLGEVTKYFTHLTKDYFSNLNQIFTIAQENNIDKNPDFLQLLDNPIVMNEVLEKGKYKKNGIEIDLNKKIITGLEKNTNLEADKKAFMKEIVQNTNETGSRIDSLKDKVDKVAGLFVKFGFDSAELKEFQNNIKEIPLVGELLSFILGFFLGDKVFNAIDKIHDSQKYKAVIEKAQVFFQKDDIKLPFEKTEKLEKKEGSNIEKFLKSVELFEQDQAGDKKIKKSVIFADNFWENTFSKDESTNPVYKEIQNKIRAINPNNDTMSQEDYFVALSKLKFIIPAVVVTTSVSADSKLDVKKTDIKTVNLSDNIQDGVTDLNGEDTGVKPLEVTDNVDNGNLVENILNEDIILSSVNTVIQKPIEKPQVEMITETANNKPLVEQLVNITSLPMEIYIDGDKTSIDIGIDKKSIILGGKSYNISVKQGNLDVLDSIQLDDGKISVTADLTLTSFTKELQANQLASVLKEISLNNSYEKEIEGGFKLMIS